MKTNMGMLFVFNAFVTSLFITISCNKSTVPEILTDSSMNVSAKSFLALGDSYTIGQSVTDSERFPAQTAAYLRTNGFNIKTPQYIATTGWTTVQLINAIQTENPQGPFDIVTLLIGVNDQYQNLDTAGYRIRFTELLEKSISLAGSKISHVFVLSIPDYSATPFVAATDKKRVSNEIDQFNYINKQITDFYKVVYVDITPSTRLAATDASLIANDYLHPSGKEYKVWSDLLAPVVLKALK